MNKIVFPQIPIIFNEVKIETVSNEIVESMRSYPWRTRDKSHLKNLNNVIRYKVEEKWIIQKCMDNQLICITFKDYTCLLFFGFVSSFVSGDLTIAISNIDNTGNEFKPRLF